MASWGPGEWTTFFIALATLIGTVLNNVSSFLTKVKSDHNAAKLETVEQKIDANTVLTKDAGEEATTNAKAAAVAANTAATTAATAVTTAASVKESADKLADKLNGELDQRITTIVKLHTEPIIEAIKELSERIKDR
jgi:uncharacterized protein YqgV (UPF0045/DUF77 family)